MPSKRSRRAAASGPSSKRRCTTKASSSTHDAASAEKGKSKSKGKSKGKGKGKGKGKSKGKGYEVVDDLVFFDGEPLDWRVIEHEEKQYIACCGECTTMHFPSLDNLITHLDNEKKRRCPYTILGIERNATADAIKKAYRGRVLIVHPDKSGKDTKEEFFELMSAYEILNDCHRRCHYDVFNCRFGKPANECDAAYLAIMKIRRAQMQKEATEDSAMNSPKAKRNAKPKHKGKSKRKKAQVNGEAVIQMVTDLVEQKAELKNKNAELKNKNAELKNKNAELKNKNAELKNKSAKLKEAFGAVLKGMLKDYDQLKKVNEELKKVNEELKAKYEKFRQQLMNIE